MKILKNNLEKVILLAAIIICCLTTAWSEKKNSIEQNISYSEDGMLIKNGERIFVIGSYHHPKTDNPFKSLKTNGYNYVRVSAKQNVLDSAFNYNLNTWVTTGSIKNKKKDDSLRISKLVTQYKDDKSILFWEMEDEPAFTWNSAKVRIAPKPLEQTYNFIKSIDPNHLIITNHGPVNLISTLKKYNNSTDVVACDVYPVIPHGIKPSYALYPDGLQGDLLNPYISQVGEYVDKMKKVVNNSKPVFMVLQGFAWEMLKKEEERDTSKILYPTYKESRFMAYNAIVHGATGILYWGTNYTPQPSNFINNLNKVTKELAEYNKILASPNYNMTINKQYHELRYSVDAGIEHIIKKFNDKIYLITINSDKNPVKVSIKGLKNYKYAKVLKEQRSLDITNNMITDNYKPFDVHIYELNN